MYLKPRIFCFKTSNCQFICVFQVIIITSYLVPAGYIFRVSVVLYKNIAFGKELMLCFGFNHALLYECISVFSQEEGDVKASIFKLTKRE